MSKKYDDIINLPRPISKTRTPMALIDRASQFSPFAALTGHETAVKETARLTEKRVELDKSEKNYLSDRLQFIAERINEQHEISITYFQPDTKKNGGAYLTANGIVKKIDDFERLIVMADGKQIPVDEVFNVEGQIFEILCDE